MFPLNINPSYGSGFAFTQEMSAHPEMWDNLVFAAAPFLGAAGKLMDWSGKGNHGDIVGPTWVGGALNFPGVNEYVNIGDRLSLDISGDKSILAWMKVGDYTNFNNIIVRSQATPNVGYSFQMMQTTGKLSYVKFGVATVLTVGLTVPLGTWVFVAVVKDSTKCVFYLDSKSEIVVSTQVELGGSNPDVNIGRSPRDPGDTAFNGQIRQVLFYNCALNTSEVAAQYRNPKGWAIRKPAVTYFIAPAVEVYKPQSIMVI